MNIFYLDEDLDTCAQFHIEKHVGKMQLEAAQLLTSALWVDKYLGHIPRSLEKIELAEINKYKAKEPVIDERTFTRYLPTHINHPSAIWVRSSLENYYYTLNYIIALNDESLLRGKKSHASCAEALRLPDPKLLPNIGFTKFAQAMPDELKRDNPVEAYRLFYMLDKAAISGGWGIRGKPYWWDEDIAMYDVRYTELNPLERQKRYACIFSEEL